MILFDYGHGWSVLINPKVIYKRSDHGRQYLITGNYSKNNSIINAYTYITFNKWIEFYVIVILTLFSFLLIMHTRPSNVIFNLLDNMLKLIHSYCRQGHWGMYIYWLFAFLYHFNQLSNCYKPWFNVQCIKPYKIE